MVKMIFCCLLCLYDYTRTALVCDYNVLKQIILLFRWWMKLSEISVLFLYLYFIIFNKDTILY